MVPGLDKFKEYFKDFNDQYVFIGGTACDIIMNELGVPFRATKDLDMVLIVETLVPSFGEAFWRFIEDGGYKHLQKSTGKNQFYRFSHPEDRSYPKMIELFSKVPDNLVLKFANGLMPVHIDDNIVSLSAILLNDVYYEFLVSGKSTVAGFSVIEIETVIVFKIKAWLDLKERKENGDQIDSKNIAKHKNDVFRLLANVSPSSRVETPKAIQNDISSFIDLIKDDKPDLKNLGLSGLDIDEILLMLHDIFIETGDSQQLL